MSAAPGAREALIADAIKQTFGGDDGSYEQYMGNHPSHASPFTNCQDFTCLHARATADNALRALEAAGFDVVEAPMTIWGEEPPPPTPQELRCFWHGEEPIPEGAYRVCGECWHCWPTPEALMVDVATMAREVGLSAIPSDPAAVFFCPLCAHDF